MCPHAPSSVQGKVPEAESLLATGRPTKATKFADLTLFGKMYLFYFTPLHLRGRGLLEDNSSAKNRTAK